MNSEKKKFETEISRNHEIEEFSKRELFRLKFLGGKSNGTVIPGKEFPKISVYLTRLSSFF